jgi:hypothetical protein
MNGTGWIWMAITDPNGPDPVLQRGVQVYARSGAFSYTWNGVTQAVGWNPASSDPINRIFPFLSYSDIARSSTSPFAERITNVEVWTTWPAHATAHPMEFK